MCLLWVWCSAWPVWAARPHLVSQASHCCVSKALKLAGQRQNGKLEKCRNALMKGSPGHREGSQVVWWEGHRGGPGNSVQQDKRTMGDVFAEFKKMSRCLSGTQILPTPNSELLPYVELAVIKWNIMLNVTVNLWLMSQWSICKNYSLYSFTFHISLPRMKTFSVFA